MTSHDTEHLKRLAIIALFSDDELVDRLVLKGGNALSLAHHLASRASFDLDFSMEGQFERAEIPELTLRIEHRLKQTFLPEAYAVFDVRLEPRPENLSPDLQEFWGGYSLEFKLISQHRYEELDGTSPRSGGKLSHHDRAAGREFRST